MLCHYNAELIQWGSKTFTKAKAKLEQLLCENMAPKAAMFSSRPPNVPTDQKHNCTRNLSNLSNPHYTGEDT